jgi:hypothetical protein
MVGSLWELEGGRRIRVLRVSADGYQRTVQFLDTGEIQVWGWRGHECANLRRVK